MTDREHWLWRLSDRDWIEAAQHELELAREHLGTRRTAITHARRATGMALNGVLVTMADRGWTRERCEAAWGRSYIDHVRAIADPGTAVRGPFGSELSELCRTLLAITVMPPTGLVRLATRKDEAASQAVAAAATIVQACAEVIGSPGDPNGSGKT